MNELELKYGCNPNQKPARIFMKDGGNLPIQVLNGKPGYINLLDAFNSWQLVKELKEATGLCCQLQARLSRRCRRGSAPQRYRPEDLFCGGRCGSQSHCLRLYPRQRR